MNNFDVIVIGAGASGLMAGGRAGEQGLNVCLLEKKARPGIKLSITGKGRCNITNSANLKEFISEFGDNGKFLFSAFNKFFNNDLISFFENHGVKTRLERGGRYFPLSDDAHSVVNALIQYVKKNKVKIKTSCEVKKITKENNSIKDVILSTGEILKAKKYILATGGLSYPQTGSTGDGFKFAKQLGHTVIAPSPSLVPLVLDCPYLKQLNGLKLKNIEITVLADGKEITKLFGELEFTIFGLAGPVILTVSALVYGLLRDNQKVEISINLKSSLDDKQLDQRLVRELNNFGSLPVRHMLKELLPLQLIDIFMKITNLNHTKKCFEISKLERQQLFNGLRSIKFKVSATRPINEAIITRGGISLNEVEQNTMQSKLIDNLYFCGEILDLDGPTGGFNLQVAFSTGYLAGNNTEDKKFRS
ncbi:NAD(P)/FAD-dependent oxidoreductase [Elusimicrobiota bacterium]